MNKKNSQHSFSIEMLSKKYLSHTSISDEEGDAVLIKGELGEIVNVSLQEGLALEVQGANGTLRLDLTREELSKINRANNKEAQQ